MARDATGAVGDSAGDDYARVALAVDPSYSAFNYTLSFFGVGPIPWTGDEIWARFSVILVNIWVGAPFFMIMYLAALKSVPEQLYEAAAIDGANWSQRTGTSRYR